MTIAINVKVKPILKSILVVHIIQKDIRVLHNQQKSEVALHEKELRTSPDGKQKETSLLNLNQH